MNTPKEEIITSSSEKSEISEFFVGQSIFLTGASGFLGKILLEKLLRSCSGVKKIYILLRKKHEINVADRFTHIFNSQLFKRLKEENPNFADQVAFINGDCEKPNLGLSTEDRELLIQEITCIFHVAATVKFTEHIRIATHINVRAVKDLLTIAKEMKQLKAFVYVSTAYSNCNRDTIGEQVYEAPIATDKLLSIVSLLDDDSLEAITPRLCRDWPNTYSFTKAVAENIIVEEGRSLPIVIVRPAIVITTLEDPYPGWGDSFYGPIGLTVGICAGVIRIFVGDINGIAELVPADFVINHAIAAAWDVENRHLKSGNSELTVHPKVFNYVSSVQNPLIWSKYTDNDIIDLFQSARKTAHEPFLACVTVFRFKNRERKISGEFYGILITLRQRFPFLYAVWYPFVTMTSSLWLYKFFSFFLHSIPGFLVDGLLIIFGRKPIIRKLNKKVDKYVHIFKLFSLKKWKFYNDNTQELWNKLSKADKNVFKFDMSSFSWSEKLPEVAKGGRIYLMKDPLSTLPLARKKMFVQKLLHYSFIVFLLYNVIKFSCFCFESIIG